MAGQPYAIINRLVVKNYRSIVEIDLELGPLTVFVGPNGSGKSNIIDAFHFVRDCVTRNLDSAIIERGGMGAICRWTPKGLLPSIGITAYLRAKDWSGEYGFELNSNRRGDYAVKSERLVFREVGQPLEWKIKNRKWITYPPSMNRPSAILPGDRLVLPQFIHLSPEPAPWIVRFLQNMEFYRLYPDDMRSPQKPFYPWPLEERGLNLASVLRSIRAKSDNYAAFSDSLRHLIDGVTSYSVEPVGGYLVTKLHHDATPPSEQGPSLALLQESDGTLRILAILAALYQRPPSLLAIEEPEMGIHPGALAGLCDLIQEASLRGQVLVSSHSPDIIDRFPAESFRIVEKEGGITKVGMVSEVQRGAIAERLFSPGELMRIEGLRRDAEPAIAP